MKIHELKTKPEYFEAARSSRRTSRSGETIGIIKSEIS